LNKDELINDSIELNNLYKNISVLIDKSKKQIVVYANNILTMTY